VAAARPDAIVILCTDLRGEPAAEIGIPVLDPVMVTVEHCLDRLA